MAVEKKDKEKEKISTLLEDLASLESYAKDLLSFLPLPVCLASSIGIILEANPAFERISGYRTEEIIGKPIEEIFTREEIEKIYKETLEKGSVSAREMNIFTKDKKKLLVSTSTILRQSEEGEIIGYFLGFFDLTEVKETEKELKKRINELEKFHRLTIGRELKMIELKKEIERLKQESEQRKG